LPTQEGIPSIRLDKPAAPTGRLASEAIILASPLSFAGSAQRIWRLTHQVPWLTVAVAIVAIFLAWIVVAVWYAVAFGLFGILVIPWRLFWRSGRKSKRQAAQHREVMEALNRR
jgi:Flp pilus assembly protein TadB